MSVISISDRDTPEPVPSKSDLEVETAEVQPTKQDSCSWAVSLTLGPRTRTGLAQS